MVPVIEMRGVARTYPGPPPVEALTPSDIVCDEGDWIAITGRSGSGKSTLLNLIGLLDRPSLGTYLLDGHDVSTLDEAARTNARGAAIGFVFQAFHLLNHLTASENVELGLLYRGTSRVERRARSARVLDQVGMAHRMDARPTTLSGGERQRVAIARALVRRPRVLLCDEPTGSLDSGNAAQMLDLLADLHASGLTIVVVTHDPAVAKRASRQLDMRDGRVWPDEAPRT